MNYKKMGKIGALYALGVLASQNTKADIYVIKGQPVYTTTYTIAPAVYTTTPVSYTTAPVSYTTTSPIIIQQPTVNPAVYNNAYYNGYYDTMNRRWWYNNSWTYSRPPMCPPPHIYGGYHGYRPSMPHHGYCAPRPNFNHCAPVRPHFNHCTPARPNFNHCGPRGGFGGGFNRGGGFHGGRGGGFHGRGCR